eukprot:3650320-Amphidinium_carterae.1
MPELLQSLLWLEDFSGLEGLGPPLGQKLTTLIGLSWLALKVAGVIWVLRTSLHVVSYEPSADSTKPRDIERCTEAAQPIKKAASGLELQPEHVWFDRSWEKFSYGWYLSGSSGHRTHTQEVDCQPHFVGGDGLACTS